MIAHYKKCILHCHPVSAHNWSRFLKSRPTIISSVVLCFLFKFTFLKCRSWLNCFFHLQLMHCFKITELGNKCLVGRGLILWLISSPERVNAFRDRIGRWIWSEQSIKDLCNAKLTLYEHVTLPHLVSLLSPDRSPVFQAWRNHLPLWGLLHCPTPSSLEVLEVISLTSHPVLQMEKLRSRKGSDGLRSGFLLLDGCALFYSAPSQFLCLFKN